MRTKYEEEEKLERSERKKISTQKEIKVSARILLCPCLLVLLTKVFNWHLSTVPKLTTCMLHVFPFKPLLFPICPHWRLVYNAQSYIKQISQKCTCYFHWINHTSDVTCIDLEELGVPQCISPQPQTDKNVCTLKVWTSKYVLQQLYSTVSAYWLLR